MMLNKENYIAESAKKIEIYPTVITKSLLDGKIWPKNCLLRITVNEKHQVYNCALLTVDINCITRKKMGVACLHTVQS